MDDVDGDLCRLAERQVVVAVVMLATTSRLLRGHHSGTAGRRRAQVGHRRRVSLNDVVGLNGRRGRRHAATDTIIDVLQYRQQAKILSSETETMRQKKSLKRALQS